MYKTALDARTLETQLRQRAGADFCTYADVQAVTGMSYRQVRERLCHTLEALPGVKPRRFYVPHVAQVVTQKRRGGVGT